MNIWSDECLWLLGMMVDGTQTLALSQAPGRNRQRCLYRHVRDLGMDIAVIVKANINVG